MLYAKLIGHIALFTCENIAHIEFYLQGLLPKILAMYTIKLVTSFISQRIFTDINLGMLELKMQCIYNTFLSSGAFVCMSHFLQREIREMFLN